MIPNMSPDRATPPAGALARLEKENVLWFATVRPDGRPHLVPLSFVWSDEKIYLCIQSSSVKARNLRLNPKVVFALQDGSDPLIGQGEASPVPPPWPAKVRAAFLRKLDWDIAPDSEYDQLIEVVLSKWVVW